MESGSEKMSTYTILILINVRWWNATAFYAVNIGRILHKKGHRVIIGCNKTYPAYEIARSYGLKSVPLNFYGFNPFELLSNFFKLLRLIKKEKIQIINSHRPEDHTFALLTKLITGVKLVTTRGDRRLISGNLLSTLRYRLCDAVVLTCQSIFHQNDKIFLPMKKRVHIIYGSVDEEHFKIRNNKNQTLQKYKINPKKMIVGMAGRLGYVKDQFTFVRAASLVLQESVEVVFIIAGKETQIKEKELKKMLNDLKISDHFILLPEIKDIVEVIDLFDIGVITSVSSETISRVLLEYMYLGKPVIGTKVNAIGEIIRPGVNGELVEPKDYKNLAISIRKIIENISLRREYGNNSKRLYKENYSEDVFYKKYIKVFESVTS